MSPPDRERGRPRQSAPQVLSTTPAHSDDASVSETAVEVLARLEAIQANSSYALLGLLPVGPVLESNVVLAAQAARWLQVAA